MTDEILLKKVEEIFAPLKRGQEQLTQAVHVLSQDVGVLKHDMQSVKAEQAAQGKTLKYLKTKVNRIDKTVDIIGRTYDERIVKNAREIGHIKEHLGFQ